MKKIFLVLAIVLIATPVWAGVTIEAAQTGPNEVTVTYDMDDTDPNLVRAFALEISLTNDANIGPVSDVHPEYYIYPGSIVITGGVVTDQGTPVVVVDDSSIIVEMGSLYAAEDPEHKTAPAPEGTLLKFTVGDSCHVGLAENLLRGGVVLEDTTQETVVNFIECDVDVIPDKCFPSDHPDYAEWLAVGEPNSWCYPRQCHGDADNAEEQIGKPYYWVGYNDLTIFLAGFGQLEYVDPVTDPWIAADFDHAEEQIGKPYYRVGYDDLNIFLANFGQLTVDPNCP